MDANSGDNQAERKREIGIASPGLLVREASRLLLCIAAVVLLIAASNSGAAAEKRKDNTRTRAEVEALIENVGRTPPDWYGSAPLNYPRTLDLSWPKPSGPWNTRKHISHYMFSVINENPGRW